MPYLGSTPAEKALEADDIASDAVTTAKIANDAVDITKINLVSTSSVPSLEAKGDGSSDGYIQLNCSQNSHGIKLKSPPHSAGQSYTLTYPQSVVDGGFMKTDSSGNLSFAGAGKIAQVVQAQSTSVNTTTDQITHDNSIPQNNEGEEMLTLAITPTNASSTLFIFVDFVIGTAGSNVGSIIALFKDSTANAIESKIVSTGTVNNIQADAKFIHKISAGSTSAQTFKVRIGCAGSGTISMNSYNASDTTLGGTMKSSIVIMEVLP
jgi:hypothetical protein